MCCFSVFPDRISSHVSDALRCSITNHIRIILEHVYSKEPVMIRRLVLRRNTEPAVVRIKRRAHDRFRRELR